MSAQRVRMRPDVAAIQPYRQGRMAASDAFKLSSNENPYDPLPAVVAAVAASPINRYPDGAAPVLRERIAARWGVTPSQVYVGPGSVSIIGHLLTAMSGPGTEVVFAEQSFEAYAGLTAAVGAKAVTVPSTPDGRHDIPAMTAAITDRTRLIFLCSPNNPTSTIITREEFDAAMAAIPSDLLVVLDEAYIEFNTNPDAVDGREVIGRYPNVIALRTFSKAWGLAGLRVGYGVAAEYIIDAINAIHVPLAITDMAQRAAVVSLEHEDELLERVAVIVERRDRVQAALRAQGWEVPEAQGNFVWLPAGDRAAEAGEYFAQQGLMVRPIGTGVRVSIGEEESVEPLLRSANNVIDALRSGAPIAG